MSDPRLEAIRARLEKVSECPWHQEFGADREKYGFRIYDVRGLGVCKPTKGHAAQDEANSDFIVEAPDDMRYLLALIDTLQRERDEARSKVFDVDRERAESVRQRGDVILKLHAADTHIHDLEAQVSRLTEALASVFSCGSLGQAFAVARAALASPDQEPQERPL